MTLTLIAAWVGLAGLGLTIGFISMRSLGDRVPLIVPTTSAASLPAPATTLPFVLTLEATTFPAERAQEPGPIEWATPSTPSPSQLPPTPQPTATPLLVEGPREYGRSFNDHPLVYYTIGTGTSKRAIIGGIHGGYEWNTVELVSETLTYLQENPELVPEGVTLYVIPIANPDGYHYYRDDGADPYKARENGNGKDLNRNWDYEHQKWATHGTRPVYAGEDAFSERETRALSDLITGERIEAAIFYHSAMGKVFYGAEVGNSHTYDLADVVSEATGYPIAARIPGQITTGDAIDWMSDVGKAGIEVELTTHSDIEWERNLRGLLAFLQWVPPDTPPGTEPVHDDEVTVTYVVQEGDTLLGIAGARELTVDELLELNKEIDNLDAIRVGQTLTVPPD